MTKNTRTSSASLDAAMLELEPDERHAWIGRLQTFVAVADFDHQHAAFGEVLKGDDVLEKLANVPTKASGGEKSTPIERIAIESIAIVAAAYVFIEPFKQGVLDLGKDVKKILSDGKIGRVGTTR